MSMDEAWKKQAAERIRAITPAPAGLSKAARFRELMPELEDAMQRGVSQSDLVAVLADSGLVMTLDELRNALYRERKRQKRTRKPDETPAPKPPASAPPPPAAEQQKNPGTGFDWQAIRDSKPNW